MNHLRRIISLLLVLVLCFGLIPGVSAAEADTPGTDTQTEATGAEETVPTSTEDTHPTEEPHPETESEPEASDAPADVPMDEPGLMDAASNGISTWSIGSTQKSIMLFDYADNGDYTTRLNSQVACAYKPNGSGTTRTAYIKNLGWHFARYGGVAYADDPLYCIEPWRSYAASTSGNSVDRDVTLDGSGSTSGSNVWYALPAARREAIGLILLYSDQMWNHSISVTTTSKANNPNVPLRIATQFLIYEIVCGLRDPSTFALNSTNECGTAGNIFYNAGAASVTNFTSNYNTLVSYIQAAKKIPSFTSSSSGSAPTISLTGDETSVYDSNGVLSNFSFTDGNGAKFYKSGSTLYITQTGTISSSTVYRATRYLPSAASSTYNLWYMSGSSYQTTVSLASASSGNLNAYFKLKAPDPGTISLTKTTEDGQNLSDWRFGVYTNSACTSLAAGPYTTNSNGKISITGLTAGTYYVKELGHTDSSINAMYYCSSTNPQKVSVTSSGTTSVSFYNKLNTGSISLTKTTEDGQNLSGWQFGIYSNSACTTLVSGPHSTNTSGKISVTGLTPGTYYVKELGHTDSAINALYYCASTNPQSVTVTAGATASVSFTNKLNTGSVKLIKTTNTGANLSGWQIGLYTDADCTNAVSGSPFTTGADGTVTAAGLQKGTYYAKEIPTDDMSIVRSLRGGFPEETEKLMVFLSEPKSYQAIMRQVYAFRDACNADKGMMTELYTMQAILGSDPRGNLIRLDNALAQMPQRLKAFQTQLDETCHQQEAAKAELGKPFPFEEELRDKTARLIFLDAELNLDANKGGQTEQVIAKSARPSVLDKLRSQPAPIRNNQKQKRHEEVR